MARHGTKKISRTTTKRNRPRSKQTDQDAVTPQGDGFVWAVADVASRPVIHLVRWRIFQLSSERCIYGAVSGIHSGRRSSWIRAFDPKTMRATTSSGRIYELIGPPGHDDNAQYLLEQDLAQGHPLEDVTTEACRDYGVSSNVMRAGTQ